MNNISDYQSNTQLCERGDLCPGNANYFAMQHVANTAYTAVSQYVTASLQPESKT